TTGWRDAKQALVSEICVTGPRAARTGCAVNRYVHRSYSSIAIGGRISAGAINTRSQILKLLLPVDQGLRLRRRLNQGASHYVRHSRSNASITSAYYWSDPLVCQHHVRPTERPGGGASWT